MIRIQNSFGSKPFKQVGSLSDEYIQNIMEPCWSSNSLTKSKISQVINMAESLQVTG
jgi:hypothetical protein